MNGTGAPVSSSSSMAEQLQQKHAASDVHAPTVEEVIDEEDIMHPPPSLATAPKSADSSTMPILVPADETMSEKAIGKQKARGDSEGLNQSEKNSNLNTKSEELFPALGGGPKSRTPAQVYTAWGSKKPASVANGVPNGINGHDPASSAASSRSATPASGILTPGSTNASAPRGLGPQHMSMPGRHSERVQFAPSQLLPRKEMKKPLQDVLRDINKKSKATVEMKPGPEGMIQFEGKGPVDAVRQALKDVAREVGSKQSVKVEIPLSVRAAIIGRQGTTVQGITKRTGAQIHVPKVDKASYPGEDEDDDSCTMDVTIEGDAIAAELAWREIEAIIIDRTSNMNIRLREIPAEFYPFIAGPHNTRVNALESGRDLKIKVPSYYAWSNQPPPQAPGSSLPPNFLPHPSSHIQLSGDRHAVQEARAEIERHVETLRQQITLSQLAINRGQHQFIVGESGTSLHDFLEETGCAVILPPNSDETEMLTITGPHDKIELGMEKVMNLATSMQMASLDIARQHSKAPIGAQAHARALTRYLQQRQAIAQLEKLYDSRIVLPITDEGSTTWEVYSRDGKNTIRARSDIMNVINSYPPSRLRHVLMDPFYHQHLRDHYCQNVRDDFGVHVLIPDEADQASSVVLIYEGPESNAATFEIPRQRPSSSDVAEFERSLKKAEEHILQLATRHQSIDTRDFEVPSKYHDKVRKFVRQDQRNLPSDVPPIQILNNSPTLANEKGLSAQGPKDRLDSLAGRILAFIEMEKQDELERGHTMSFEFPQKYANFLIGKRGENIAKLREEFDVEIQVNDGKVEIKGPKAKAEAAKTRIISLAKKLEDETTHIIKIKPQYHREMIGAKGSQVNRLQDRYNVRVQFPRSAQHAHDDESVADAASEVGGPRGNRSNQAPDEVIIRGPRKGADDAREELLSLLQWTIDNSHSSIVSVAQGQLPSLIGQGGKEMESIRESTGAKIDVPGNRDTVDASGRVEIKIKGTKAQVENARKLFEERAKVFDESITRSIDVDKKYHRALIGGGGANIRNIVIQAGGSDDRRELARTVRFPRPESDETMIRIEGNKAVVDKIVASIEALVGEREKQVTEILEVAPEKHRLLIGHGGETRRSLEAQFGVNIDVPKQSQQGQSRANVKLAGQPENIQKAKARILEIVKEQEGETLQIPTQLHHVISDNGQFFRRLRNDHKVTVDHAGQQPPPKPTTNPRSRVNGGAALPLITDDQEGAENFSWEIIDDNSEDTVGNKIPWVLRGSAENVAKARGILQKALEQAQQHSSTGYLILPDPKTYRFVVGQGGSQITSIRKQTGCKIAVPRDQAKGEAIEISGSREGVEQAKDIILEVVRNGSSGGNSYRRD